MNIELNDIAKISSLVVNQLPGLKYFAAFMEDLWLYAYDIPYRKNEGLIEKAIEIDCKIQKLKMQILFTLGMITIT